MGARRVDEGITGLELRRARRAVRALDDAALLDAMAAADPWAWLEFDERFRPLLERYATHIEIPAVDWPVCIDEVLADEAVRLTTPGVTRPRRLRAYLIVATRHRFLRLRRAAMVRERNHAAAAWGDGETVVRGLCSEHALRASGYESAPDGDVYAVVAVRLADALVRELTDDERAILGWVAECVPHRTIAEWTGASYEATTKRIWRLCQRLRRRAREIVSAWPEDEDRAAIAHMLGIPVAALPITRIGLADGAGTRSGGAER